MIRPIVAIRDVKSSWLNPLCEDSIELAKREFAFACSNSDSIMGFKPEDFSMYKIGTFDTESATLIPCIPEYICSGLEVV